MTKKDYVAIAKIINNNYFSHNQVKLVEDLIKYFKQENPNFNADKFKEACEL